MRVLNNSLFITVLLFGWFITQTAAVNHEFSSEHLLSNSHFCLSQSTSTDDLIFGIDEDLLFSLNEKFIGLTSELIGVAGKPAFRDNAPRAPPSNT
ncbi:hypothetical protein [Aliikangiella sp. IMCC44359]|uniref:hypothetical protein n=1 Tax=Aliikangiella sp. IMCC44359 TaxID=3459125 RepID=UPI00403AA9CC